MKTLKTALFSLAIVLFTFTSCTKNEPVVEQQQIEESPSVTEALGELGNRYDDSGNVMGSQSPSGNIVFDFCFDFVYPIDLAYNNGTTVTVNSLDELVSVIINFTNDLYVTGIAFPFDVEVYNDDTDAIVIVTINNEEEFADLLEDCDFDIITECVCTQEYDPVCVEIEDPSGVSFTLTYPNACWAECDGFSEDDFIDDCGDDYNGNGGFECFEFNYPITIITDAGVSITVNSDEELSTALYNSYYFDFEYPFTVTTEDGDVETIEDEEDFYELLDDCYDDYTNECECDEDDNNEPVCVQIEEGGQVFIAVFPNACYAECEGFDEEDFVDCENIGGCDDCPDEYDPVCVEFETPNGVIETITFPNACYAECEGFDEEDFIDCEDDESYCTAEELAANLVECNWYISNSLFQNPVALYAQFNADGTVSIMNTQTNEAEVTGTWEIATSPATEQLFMFFNFSDEPFDEIANLDWTVVECEDGFIALQSNNEFILMEQDCD